MTIAILSRPEQSGGSGEAGQIKIVGRLRQGFPMYHPQSHDDTRIIMLLLLVSK